MTRFRFLSLSIIFVSATLLAQSNPIPLVSAPLVPASAAPGSKGFTLTVNGTGFVSGAVVNWNGSPRTTQVVSGSQVKATINASDVAQAGTAFVVVANPKPGGGASNVAYFPIRMSSKSVKVTPRSLPKGAIAVGDFNGDGKLDVAVGHAYTIEIFLGKGDGTFQQPILSSSKFEPSTMTAGDFNGDGQLDLFAARVEDKYFISSSVFFGTGDGKLSEGTVANDIYTPYGDQSLADLNDDGKLDFVSGLGGVFLGNGDGTFSESYFAPNYGQPAIGDFNGDGKLDYAVPRNSITTRETDVYLGNGDGTFQGPVAYFTSYYPLSVVTADVNGDGILDLITGGICVLLGKGDGTFTPNGCVTVGKGGVLDGNNPSVVGDFNGDGKLDVAVLVGFPHAVKKIYLLLGHGDGTFQKPIVFPAGEFPEAGVLPSGFSVGDFNGDGKLDFIVTSKRKTLILLQK